MTLLALLLALAASSFAPTLAGQNMHSFFFWVRVETQAWPRWGCVRSVMCAFPSARPSEEGVCSRRVRRILLCSAAQHKTKVCFFSKVCYQECIDEKEIGHEIWASRAERGV